MNLKRFFINITVLPFLLMTYNLSFGMIIKYKDEKNKKILQSSAKAYCKHIAEKRKKFEKLPLEIQEKLVNYWDNPLIFGLTSKTNHTMVKNQGIQNLRTVLGKKDAVSVYNFLLSHYVPILLIYDGMWCGKPKFDIINPYCRSFCSKVDFLIKDSLINNLEKKRVNQAIIALNNGVDTSVERGISINRPLVKLALFGKDEDISKELANDYYNLKQTNYDMTKAIKTIIQYPNKNNHENDIWWRGRNSYELLFIANKYKNKKAFDLLSKIDPYDANKLAWRIGAGNHQTNLDRMIEDKFDSENIKFFINNGGMSSKEAQGINVQIIEDII